MQQEYFFINDYTCKMSFTEMWSFLFYNKNSHRS